MITVHRSLMCDSLTPHTHELRSTREIILSGIPYLVDRTADEYLPVYVHFTVFVRPSHLSMLRTNTSWGISPGPFSPLTRPPKPQKPHCNQLVLSVRGHRCSLFHKKSELAPCSSPRGRRCRRVTGHLPHAFSRSTTVSCTWPLVSATPTAAAASGQSHRG